MNQHERDVIDQDVASFNQVSIDFVIISWFGNIAVGPNFSFPVQADINDIIQLAWIVRLVTGFFYRSPIYKSLIYRRVIDFFS